MKARRFFSAFGITGALVWPLTLFLAYSFASFDLSHLNGMRVDSNTLIGRDFVNIWEGGRLAVEHGSDLVYDRDGYREQLRKDVGIGGIYAFSYPPHMLVLSIPFGQLPYPIALAVWTLGGLGLFWFAAKPWLDDVGLPSWSVFLLPASLVNIWAGHFGFVIGALALIGWRQATRHPRIAGLAFAMMTVKPHMGILIPPLLAIERRWRSIIWTGVSLALLVLLSFALFGPSSWRTWTFSTLPFQASLIDSTAPNMVYLSMMPTVEKLVSAFVDLPAIVLAAQILAAMVAIGSLLWAWRKEAGLNDLALLSFLAVFAILPYSFIYDMVAADLAILIFAARWRSELSLPEKALLAATFLVPLLHVPLTRWGVPYSALAILGTLVVAARRAGLDGGKARA